MHLSIVFHAFFISFTFLVPFSKKNKMSKAVTKTLRHILCIFHQDRHEHKLYYYTYFLQIKNNHSPSVFQSICCVFMLFFFVFWLFVKVQYTKKVLICVSSNIVPCFNLYIYVRICAHIDFA